MNLRKLIREAVENAEKPFIDQFGDERPVSRSSWGDIKMPLETFASRTKSLIVDIIMEEEGISEKSFTGVDQVTREVRQFFQHSPKACKLLKELESKKVRHRYAAETIYNRWHELNELHDDDGMANRLSENTQDNTIYDTQDLEVTAKEVRDPLYKFLNHMFGDNTKLAANGFMFMQAKRLVGGPNGGVPLFWFKHGITRRYVVLDRDGEPYYLEMTVDDFDQVKNLRPQSNEEAYKNLYGDLEEFMRNSKDRTGIDAGVLTAYSSYKKWRDNYTTKNGINSKTITKTDLNEEAELRKNEVKLTDEERAEVLVNGCVWNNGSLGIWKSADKKGNVSYHSETPRASAVSTSLAKAIEKFPMIKATV